MNSLNIASATVEPSNNLKWNVKNNLLSPLNISSWKESYLGNAIRCELFLVRSIAVLSIMTAEWERRKPVDAACIPPREGKLFQEPFKEGNHQVSQGFTDNT